MSQTRFFKSVITPTLVQPTENFETGVASGVWSLQDQARARRGGVWPETGVPNPATLVENVFSTDLWDGTGANQTITNNIDLTEGGLVWLKSRSSAEMHILTDSERGVTKLLNSNAATAEASNSDISAFNNNGFSLQYTYGSTNTNSTDYVSWTFRKAPKFFDIQTWTGDGTVRNISHNLGSVPGMIIVKRTSGTSDWRVYHRGVNAGSSPQNYTLKLNDTSAQGFGALWNQEAPTSTQFTVANDTDTNASGSTYVAYLFGHDTSSDGMIQCGSYTGNGSSTGPTVDLGFEPQWLLIKNTTDSDNWVILDNMRGNPVGANDARLFPNLSNAEDPYEVLDLTATGFNLTTSADAYNKNSSNYIYMAIRRGPMATPTASSSVFDVTAYTGLGGNTSVTTGFAVDKTLVKNRGSASTSWEVFDRLRGSRKYLLTNSTAGDGTAFSSADQWLHDNNTGFTWSADDSWSNQASENYVSYNWKRAPGYFDVVAYTGTGSAGTHGHNLGVAPEMIWVKSRAGSGNWFVYHSALGATKGVYLNDTGTGATSSFFWNDTAPTASVFSLGASLNQASSHIAYLFATLAGVSKVGSVSHSGSSTDVDCGFSSGASLVMLKRTDANGDWFWWNSARGIVSGNDPYLLLNSNAAEVTNTDLIDPLSSGFTITDDFTDGTYLFYAIAAV